MSRATRGPGPSSPPIEWTAHALADLRAIEDYIAADSPVAAERWTARLIAAAETAARAPLAGRIVSERAEQDVREVFLRAYRIVYRTRDRGIVVLTIFEGHRRFPQDADAGE